MTNFRFQMRKVATIVVACLLVTTMFASCDSKNGDDDENGNTSGKIDKDLVGKWDRNSHTNNTWIDESNNFVYEGEWYVYRAEAWEFYSDGTFLYYWHNNQGLGLRGLLLYKGNYSAEDGFIYCTKVTRSLKDYEDEKNSYNFKSSDNFKLGYKIEYNVPCVFGPNHDELYLNTSEFTTSKYDANDVSFVHNRIPK